MKNKHLILLDLDGTTLYDWKTLNQETIDTISKVKALGHQVCIATGRPYRSSKYFYDQLKLRTPIINYNGALIHHPHDTKFEEISRVIGLTYVLKVFEDIGHLIENAFCEHYEDIFLYRENDDIMPLIHPEGGKVITGDFKNTMNLNPNGFILLTYPNTHKDVQNYLDEHFKGILNHRSWGGHYPQIIEIFTPRTSKGNALKKIAEYFDIPLEQTIAFGDGENDVDMIEEAGIGVAMKNAVKSVKEVANYTTRSNTENGVAYFLRNFFHLS